MGLELLNSLNIFIEKHAEGTAGSYDLVHYVHDYDYICSLTFSFILSFCLLLFDRDSIFRLFYSFS